MDKDKAKQLAIELMTQHGLQNHCNPDRYWTFAFDKAKRRAGLCSYSRKRISVSIHYVLMNPESEVRDTILHEIAHALVPTDAHHGLLWKVMAQDIGARPQCCALSSTMMPQGKYTGRCPCKVQSLHRKPKPGAVYTCKLCHGPVVWD